MIGASFHIGDLYFAYPLVLAGLIIVPILALLYYFKLRKDRHPELQMSTLQGISTHSPRGWARMIIPPVLRLAALSLLIIALARPQDLNKKENIKGEGIEIILAMDISNSMRGMDFDPTRLEASKRLAAEFIDSRQFDRIGLVIFAGEAFTQCPQTTDYEMLKGFLGQVKHNVVDEGTSIGMGLATAVNRIKEGEAESKIIILLTDGAHTHGYFTPEEATQMAKALDVRVYTIGVGRPGRIKVDNGPNQFGQHTYSYMMSQFDEPLLREIAQTTNGKYYRAENESTLRAVYADINELEKSDIEITTIEKYKEAFHTFLLWGFGLLLLEFLLKYTILRTTP